MHASDALLLAGGGLLAGVVNTLAGGGSLLTVPLLSFVGLPGSLANGTNRVGVLLQNGVASWGFWREGVSGVRTALPLLAPVAAGALLVALVVLLHRALVPASPAGDGLPLANATDPSTRFRLSLLPPPLVAAAVAGSVGLGAILLAGH